MKILKNIFFLTAFIAAFFMASTAQMQAQSNNEPAIIFQAETMDAYFPSKIPARVRDGELVLATLKKDRTQIIAKIREGKIVKVGFKQIGKDFAELPYPRTDNCGINPCLFWQQKRCFYTPWEQCICICGIWYTSN